MFRSFDGADLLSGTVIRHPLTPQGVLGARIKARRLDLGKTQEWLALAIGRHVTWISRLESGTFDPRLRVLVTIAFVLGIDLATLTAGLLPLEPPSELDFTESDSPERGA
jgi:transcriptional regulator with XRE-family HTH domain